MHISSLPSPYGIGTMGRVARDFVDFLADGGQSCWQLLPIGHTSYGNSPYQAFSSYAGNPYFIDLDELRPKICCFLRSIRIWIGGMTPLGWTMPGSIRTVIPYCT